jgi:serine/threonine-protein kinase
LLQACSAVLEAHGRGIIHRDLKPANLYVIRRTEGSEVVKVLDFGVMKRMPGGAVNAETQHTEPGTIVGTPFYTSPEQLRGSANVDARADIWSLGATLFELLAGVPPFSGKTYPQIIANVLEAKPLPLESLAHDLPEGLARVVFQCLEKDPADRYDNVADLAVALSETIELDSEQKGLIERIVRHGLVSSPFSSPSALLTPRGSQPRNFAAVTPGIKGYQSIRKRRQRLFVVTGITTLSALVVVAFGLPFLPTFGPTSGPAPSHVATTPSLRQTLPTPSLGVTAPALPEPLPSNSPSSTNGPSTKPARPTAARLVAKTAPDATANRAVEAPAPDPSAPSSARKKNPLLVRPR